MAGRVRPVRLVPQHDRPRKVILRLQEAAQPVPADLRTRPARLIQVMIPLRRLRGRRHGLKNTTIESPTVEVVPQQRGSLGL